MAVKKLLVEGNEDQDFFKSYCNNANLNAVDVFPPKTLSPSTGDGWANLINNLPILLNQLKAGDIDNLGIIIDADYPPDNNGGFVARYALITTELQKFGYKIPQKPNHTKGDLFTHNDGLPSIGLWIMPNHKDNGMFENFIETLVSHIDQLSLLAHADKSIKNLPITLFNQHLRSTKAKIFSWRAWQERPGLPLNSALNKGVLDRAKASDFETWLTNTFK